QETRLQQLIAEQREAERELETGRVRREEAAAALNKAQADSYEVGGALARIEQQIQHQREMATRLQKARDEAQNQLAEIAQHIGSDQSRLDALNEAIERDEPRLEQLRAEDEARQDTLQDAEARLQDW
ncbi:chromosome segregation protein SMC, partial [Lysobacter sp. D1-1-M9]